MKRKLLLLFFVISFLGIVVFVLLKKPKESKESFQVTDQKTWGDVSPGNTTYSETIDILGKPKKEEDTPEGKNLFYPSENVYYDNEIKIEDDKVFFVKEYLFDEDVRSLKTKLSELGNSYSVLYGPNSNSGILLYVYSEKGVAFLASPLSDLLYEVWYFSPMTIDSFLNQPFGENYSLEETQRID